MYGIRYNYRELADGVRPQVQELVNYLAREFGEDSEARSAFIKPFQESLLSSEASEEKQRKTIVLVLGAVKTLGNGNDRG